MSRALACLLAATVGCGGAPVEPFGTERAVASSAVTKPSAAAEAGSPAPLERVRRNVARSEAAWVARNPRDLLALYTIDASIVSFGAEGQRVERPEEMVRGMTGFFRGLSEARMRTARVVTADDVATVEWVMIGTTREGRVLGVPALSVMWFDAAGLVVREHVFVDEQTTAMQLGDPGARGRPPVALPSSTVWAPSAGLGDEIAVEIARSFYRALGDKDIQALGQLFADRSTYRDMSRPEDVTGREAIERDFQGFASAFPDLSVELEVVVGASGHAAVTGTWSGTMTGTLGAVASTNKRGAVHFADVFEIVDGRIASLTSYTNGAELAYAFFAQEQTRK